MNQYEPRKSLPRCPILCSLKQWLQAHHLICGYWTTLQSWSPGNAPHKSADKTGRWRKSHTTSMYFFQKCREILQHNCSLNNLFCLHITFPKYDKKAKFKFSFFTNTNSLTSHSNTCSWIYLWKTSLISHWLLERPRKLSFKNYSSKMLLSHSGTE